METNSYSKSSARRIVHFYNTMSDHERSVSYSSNNFLYLWDTQTNETRKYRVNFRDKKGKELRKILIFADDLGNYVFEMTEIDYASKSYESCEEDEEQEDEE